MLRIIFLLSVLLHGSAAGVMGVEPALIAENAQTFFVAPKKVGDGRGVAPESAADFRDMQFWSVIRQAMQKGSAIVNFLDGKYLVSADEQNAMPQLFLADLGHKDHSLVLQGASKNGVVFTRLQSDSMDGKKGPGLFKLTRSENVIVRNLHFTGKHPISYVTSFGGNKNVRIEDCSWIDLPGVYYGATGTSEPATDHVTFDNCVFKRVGSGGHAHMAYNAYGARHVAFLNCHFEDCAGDYVRFRDRTDFGVVAGCTFKSTGNYRGVNMPFISIPLFNDDDPAEELSSPNYEYFGTHFLICDNLFIYENDKAPGTRIALLFHHSGFDPPGRSHLLTRDQAKVFGNGTAADKRAFMLEYLGIEADHVHFFRNREKGTEFSVAYRSGAAFGAKSKGWSGVIDIAGAVHGDEVVKNAEQALKYFD